MRESKLVATRHAIRQTLNGSRPIEDKMKYSIIGFGVAFIHFFFALAFLKFNIKPLFIYNVGAVLFYLYLSLFSVKKEHYTTIYIGAFVEIMFHSVLASLLLGWDWGFMIYTIALVPVAFYLTYTLQGFSDKVFFPVRCSLIVMVIFMAVRVVTHNVQPLYAMDNEHVKIFFYCFNSAIAFVMLLVFSVLFSLEIRYMHRQLKQENKSLEKIANFDPLTHLANRRSMNVKLKNALEEAECGNDGFCLVMADIDNFKKVNDTYGHECGDEILILVADIVSNNIRKQDYVCRWGGEELLLLLKTDKDNALQVSQRICNEVAASGITYNNIKVTVTLTMGISAYSKGCSIRELIDIADKNLYYGKNHGKNQVVYRMV